MARPLHPWFNRDRKIDFERHGPARNTPLEDLEIMLGPRRKPRRWPGMVGGPPLPQSLRSKAGKFLGRTTNRMRSISIVGKTWSRTLVARKPRVEASQSRGTQCAFLEKLPAEIRLIIYTYVIARYSQNIHILAGLENGVSAALYHTPCITPADLEVPRWWTFDNSRWGTGLWGTYHIYCDLYSSKALCISRMDGGHD